MGQQYQGLHFLLDANKITHTTAKVPMFSFQTSYINLCNVMLEGQNDTILPTE
jgi:hypothetical protein